MIILGMKQDQGNEWWSRVSSESSVSHRQKFLREMRVRESTVIGCNCSSWVMTFKNQSEPKWSPIWKEVSDGKRRCYEEEERGTSMLEGTEGREREKREKKMEKWEREGRMMEKWGRREKWQKYRTDGASFLCIFTVSFLLSSSFLDRETDSQFSRWDSWDRVKKLWKKCTTLDTSVRNFNGM